MKEMLTPILLLFCSILSAQNEDYNNVINLFGGVNSAHKIMLGNVLESSVINYDEFKHKNSPNFGFTWDYSLGKRFSIGMYLNHARTTTEKIHPDPSMYYPTVKGQGTSFGGRGLVHIFGNHEKDNLYVGIGLGIIGWGYEIIPYNAYFSTYDVNIDLPICVGYRYFFTERLGLTSELSTSRLNRFNLGLSYRFYAL